MRADRLVVETTRSTKVSMSMDTLELMIELVLWKQSEHLTTKEATEEAAQLVRRWFEFLVENGYEVVNLDQMFHEA